MREQSHLIRLLAHPFILMMMMLLLFPTLVEGQEKDIELRFVSNTGVDCNSSVICYELQMKAEGNDTFEFGSANVRIFFDSSKLIFQSMSCQLQGLYNCSPNATVSSVTSDSMWGMGAAQYLQYNISGFFVPGLGDIITDTYHTFAEICFTPTVLPQNGEDFYGSIVWDRLQDAPVGWQSQGIIFLEQDPNGNNSFTMNEIPQHLNWKYITSNTGEHLDSLSVPWPCGEESCLKEVDLIDDVGEGSFRDAVGCATQGDTIRFAPELAGQTIFLDSERILVDKNLVIINEFLPRVNIQSNTIGAIEIAPGANVKIQNLNIISGIDGIPAAILNHGELTLQNAMINRNSNLPVNFDQLILNNGQLELMGNIEIKE
jgi:hypothetical protein